MHLSRCALNSSPWSQQEKQLFYESCRPHLFLHHLSEAGTHTGDILQKFSSSLLSQLSFLTSGRTLSAESTSIQNSSLCVLLALHIILRDVVQLGITMMGCLSFCAHGPDFIWYLWCNSSEEILKWQNASIQIPVLLYTEVTT